MDIAFNLSMKGLIFIVWVWVVYGMAKLDLYTIADISYGFEQLVYWSSGSKHIKILIYQDFFFLNCPRHVMYLGWVGNSKCLILTCYNTCSCFFFRGQRLPSVTTGR